MNIGNAIKTVRLHAGLSQLELSDITGLSQTSISQIEGGIKSPSKKSIEKICKALKIPEAVLYILGMDNNDIPAGKKKIFEELYPDIRDLAIQLLGAKKSGLIK